jgi:hypothetical protein
MLSLLLHNRTPSAVVQSRKSRLEFAESISKVQVGMLRGDVVCILGEPDDIRTYPYARTKVKGCAQIEILCYGTSGKNAFPSLGQVYIGLDGRVRLITGNTGSPPKSDVILENELCRAMECLDELPSATSLTQYNPEKVIRAVNLLHGMGKTKAIACMREYLRVTPYWSDGRSGLFLVLRVLFEIPKDKRMPMIHVGEYRPGTPTDWNECPLYPLLVVEDVPFLIPFVVTIAGSIQDPSEHIDFFQRWGHLRSSRLNPPRHAIAVVDRMAAKGIVPGYKGMSTRDQELVFQGFYRQAARLVE